MKKPFILAISFATLAHAVIADDIIAVDWASGSGSSVSAQVYTVDSSTGDDQHIGSSGFFQLNAMAKSLSGMFYSVDGSNNLVVIDPTDGSGAVVATLDFGAIAPDARGLAFSPNNTLFAIEDVGFPDDLYTIDVNTGVGTRVGATGLNQIQGLAFAPNGTLYGWDTAIGLVTINTATGAATDVNPSEGASADIQCLAFAPDGTLYGAHNGLFTIDTATGVPTLVGGSLSQIRGMEFDTGPALLVSIVATGSGAKICWFTETNATYQLQERTNLNLTNMWADVGPQYMGTGGEICVTNSTGGLNGFYRVRTVSP